MPEEKTKRILVTMPVTVLDDETCAQECRFFSRGECTAVFPGEENSKYGPPYVGYERNSRRSACILHTAGGYSLEAYEKAKEREDD